MCDRCGGSKNLMLYDRRCGGSKISCYVRRGEHIVIIIHVCHRHQTFSIILSENKLVAAVHLIYSVPVNI